MPAIKSNVTHRARPPPQHQPHPPTYGGNRSVFSWRFGGFQNTHSEKDSYLPFFKLKETPWITTTCLFMDTLININIWWKILQGRERGKVEGHNFWPALNHHTSTALSTQYALIRWANKQDVVKNAHQQASEWVFIATYCVHITVGEIES